MPPAPRCAQVLPRGGLGACPAPHRRRRVRCRVRRRSFQLGPDLLPPPCDLLLVPLRRAPHRHLPGVPVPGQQLAQPGQGAGDVVGAADQRGDLRPLPLAQPLPRETGRVEASPSARPFLPDLRALTRHRDDTTAGLADDVERLLALAGVLDRLPDPRRAARSPLPVRRAARAARRRRARRRHHARGDRPLRRGAGPQAAPAHRPGLARRPPAHLHAGPPRRRCPRRRRGRLAPAATR